jgi:5-methylcytosine-specific restriction enzyme subunit McrC
MLYASDLVRIAEVRNVLTDRELDDLPDVIATLLANEVQRRLQRNLTLGYRHRVRAVTRVRGRIDILTTQTRMLLERGEVFCRFEELTIDTPRSRLVRAALDRMARLVKSTDLKRRCRALEIGLGRAGVGGNRPPRSELAQDRTGRNDSVDRKMVALAELSFDLALPTEDIGTTPLNAPDRDKAWVYRLFEKAVLGFAGAEFGPLGWRTRGDVRAYWQVEHDSEGLRAILPGMRMDILIDNLDQTRRFIIDTKFASIVAPGRFRDEILKNGYLYQLYAYLRSQEGCEPLWNEASGMLLHPAIGERTFERARIQNHWLVFATVDLSRRPSEIRTELRAILQSFFEAPSADARPS